MEIKINAVPDGEKRPKPQDESKLGFGKIYSDHMFIMTWEKDKGWHSPTIQQYGPLSLEPATIVLHYGQTIFEGLKCYRTADNTFNLFRDDRNFERFNESAARLDMPQVPREAWDRALQELIRLDHDWVPRSGGASLYVRPFMIATEPYIGLKSSSSFYFMIITGPVGAYYPEGFNPVRIQVTEKYSRAGPKGLGGVKTAANYAASLLAEKEAQQAGYTQVLWLDAAEAKYVEEVGSMNIMFKIGGTVVTPPVGSTTLAGITRDSTLQLLRDWGVPVEERKISIDEIMDAQNEGTLEEVFGTGTAAVISPVGVLNYRGTDYTIADGGTGSTAEKLFDRITAVQYGRAPDPHNWIRTVRVPQAQQAQQAVAR